ncbi:hypothetical protein GCM10023216_01960 [Isoptericola chiayiensis]|uniref:Uncharacterized protein n=1 Tax=Isoptericola chiayiensis TaxID=579446 RepID=A0ABP8Y0N8_9MICO|nr:hypothetical protein [Isoptericola chiayiensis]NOW01241.1 positive regulator of sigma E activity [Isoptericola chiayiensis]
MEHASNIALLLILVLLVRELRIARQVVRSDPSLDLRSNERFRTLRMQLLEPLVALVVVGALLAADLQHHPVHLVLVVVGGALGYAFGVYRARTTYVSSVPQHRGLVLRYNVESFVALGLLVVIKVVAEQDLLPDGGVFRAVIAAMLGFLVVESFARVLRLVRYYQRERAEE